MFMILLHKYAAVSTGNRLLFLPVIVNVRENLMEFSNYVTFLF